MPENIARALYDNSARLLFVRQLFLCIVVKYALFELFNPLTAVGTFGTKFLKPHYYFGIGPFLNPINYFDYKKVKLFFSEEILIF